ncbi:MAG: hypothetical protein H6835_04060 [Planctomycetes bacterium]|nr:hypothetical protein [Planctomycetota bacterium]
MPTPPSDPAPDAAFAEELRQLRRSLDVLVAENASLRQRLELSESARHDLVAQAEHLIHMLDVSRKELREAKGGAKG